MKKTILSLSAATLLFAACSKDYNTLERPVPPVQETCIAQSKNPSGLSYAMDSLLSYNCSSKFCGLMPVSAASYWVYSDSIFNDGSFVRVQFDTLRFTASRSLPDSLTWWRPSISIGLPDHVYINDSAFFKLEERMFTQGILDVKKEFAVFSGDSARYLTNFEDAAAMGRALKINSAIDVAAGSYNDCFYFEKYARMYRKDQVFFKPGVGVLKYIQEKVPMGMRDLKLQQVSTLVKFVIR